MWRSGWEKQDDKIWSESGLMWQLSLAFAFGWISHVNYETLSIKHVDISVSLVGSSVWMIERHRHRPLNLVCHECADSSCVFYPGSSRPHLPSRIGRLLRWLTVWNAAVKVLFGESMNQIFWILSNGKRCFCFFKKSSVLPSWLRGSVAEDPTIKRGSTTLWAVRYIISIWILWRSYSSAISCVLYVV